MKWKLFISDQAKNDINEIWKYGYTKFGIKVADDYDNLINQALCDLCDNPYRVGTRALIGFNEELYAYHLVFSKRQAKSYIKKPRHNIYYYILKEKIVAIASVSRDSREQHIRNLSKIILLEELNNEADEK